MAVNYTALSRDASSGVRLAVADMLDEYPEAKLHPDTVIEMMDTLSVDRRKIFDVAEKYFAGEHEDPFVPEGRNEEVAILRKRSVQNWMPLMVKLPAQLSFVEGYRRGVDSSRSNEDSGASSDNPRLALAAKAKLRESRFPPEYEEWLKNGMLSKQQVIYNAALKYGHAYVVYDTVDPSGEAKVRILPTRRTIAFFDDPVNDIRPVVIATIKRTPQEATAENGKTGGLIVAWDETHRYEYTYDDGDMVLVGNPIPHGINGCPAVRYSCYIDDEGRTMGLVFPNMNLQDRVNQSAFMTDSALLFTSFKVRAATGLVPQFRRDREGQLILNDHGEPIPIPIRISMANLLTVDNPQAKFMELGATEIKPFIEAEHNAQETLASVNQFPAELMTGRSISNLSAEAIEAAKDQLNKFVETLKVSWAESHKLLLRIIAEHLNETEGATAWNSEIRWRDMSAKSFATIADGIGKLVNQAGLPQRAGWAMIPNVSATQLRDMEEMKEEEAASLATDLGQSPQTAANRERTIPTTRNGGVNGAVTDRGSGGNVSSGTSSTRVPSGGSGRTSVA